MVASAFNDFDFASDDRAEDADLAEVFAVPGLPALPALKPRWAAGEAPRILHPLWQSQPEPGIVETLQNACATYTHAETVEAPATRRARRSRGRKARG